MSEIESNDIQFFVLIPVFITDDFYRMLDPDEHVDTEYATQLSDRRSITTRPIPEMFQPLFITDDFKATFRPTALDLKQVNEQQEVQAILPELSFVVRFKWRYETLCNFGLLVLEFQPPPYTSMQQMNDLIDVIQHDVFSWSDDADWLLPHASITTMLDIPPDEPLGLSVLVSAFARLLNFKPIVKSEHPFVANLLQMNIHGGDDFYEASQDFGEYLLQHRLSHLSALFGFHEEQDAFSGNNWRCAQNLDMCGWYEWQPPSHRDTPLMQYRHAPENFFTNSTEHRRAARRVFKITTMDYIAARTVSHLLASKGESAALRRQILAVCKEQARQSPASYEIMHRLSQLEARYILLSANITNPDWVLENPFGEGNRFVQMMQYMSTAYGIHTHVNALRQQLELFDKMLDRCL
jgi:hypothetical protein